MLGLEQLDCRFPKYLKTHDSLPAGWLYRQIITERSLHDVHAASEDSGSRRVFPTSSSPSDTVIGQQSWGWTCRQQSSNTATGIRPVDIRRILSAAITQAVSAHHDRSW